MATADSVKSKINGLISKANDKTGKTDSTLTAAVDRLITGYGQGSGTGITPTGTIKITENGDYDVTSYAKANVAIPEVEQAVPEITVNEDGRIGYTITQEEGYVAGGTRFGSQTQPTQSAKTVTPGVSTKTAVAKGVFTTGEVKVAGDSNLVASNIKSGVSIFGVDGTCRSDGGAEAGALEELHYWEKYVSGDSGIVETEVSDVTVSYKSSSADTWPNIQYSDEIVNNDGTLSLLNPTTVALDFTNRDIIVGKYVRAYDYKFYRVPEDATTSIFSSQYGSSVSATKAYQLAGVAVSKPLGVVVSADSAAYPNDGEQDGYRYVYMGTLSNTGGGDGSLPTLTNPGAATDLATGKQLIDGNGNIVTGTLFELTAGNTLYANNNPALSWRTDGQVETVGTYGVAGTGDGGIVRPGSKFAIRTPAEQYGNATAEDVAIGKTFTSAAGLKVIGTGTGAGGSGIVMMTGTTVSNVIDTGLSTINAIVLYKKSISATGLIQLTADLQSESVYYSYCSSSSDYVKNAVVAEGSALVAVEGGTITWNGSSTAALTADTEYNWIAVGTV